MNESSPKASLGKRLKQRPQLLGLWLRGVPGSSGQLDWTEEEAPSPGGRETSLHSEATCGVHTPLCWPVDCKPRPARQSWTLSPSHAPAPCRASQAGSVCPVNLACRNPADSLEIRIGSGSFQHGRPEDIFWLKQMIFINMHCKRETPFLSRLSVPNRHIFYFHLTWVVYVHVSLSSLLEGH